LPYRNNAIKEITHASSYLRLPLVKLSSPPLFD
jgi:hypothetical protein